MSGGFDLGDRLCVARGSPANQKERCRGIVLLQNLQDLGCEDRVRPIIEGKCDQRIVGPNSVNDLRRKSLEQIQNSKRLDPKGYQRSHAEHTGDEKPYHHVQ